MEPAYTVTAHINIMTRQIKDFSPKRPMPPRFMIDNDNCRHKLAITHPARLLAMGFGLLILGSRCANATIVVIYRQGTSVTIGADSKTAGPTQPSCKIQACGDRSFVTFAGTVGYTSGTELIDFPAIARQACAEDGAISQRLARFERMILPNLQRLADELKQGDPERWAKIVWPWDVFDAGFVAVEHGTPNVLLRHFFLNSDGTIHIEQQTLPDRDSFVVLGVNTIADQWRAEHRQVSPSSPAEWIRQLIAVQADATPEFVARPINIVRVTSDGVEWIQPTGACRQAEAKDTNNQPPQTAPQPIPFPGPDRR